MNHGNVYISDRGSEYKYRPICKQILNQNVSCLKLSINKHLFSHESKNKTHHQVNKDHFKCIIVHLLVTEI